MCSVVVFILFTDNVRKSKISNSFWKFQRYQENTLENVCDENLEAISWTEKEFKKSIRRHVWDFSNHLVYCPIPGIPEEFYRILLNLLDVNKSLVEYLSPQKTSTRNIYKKVIRNISTKQHWAVNDLIKAIYTHKMCLLTCILGP